MTFPPNFGQAYDLSGLGKPPVDTSARMPGLEVTAANLTAEFLPMSAQKPVVVLCWSARSADPRCRRSTGSAGKWHPTRARAFAGQPPEYKQAGSWQTGQSR